MTSPFLVPLDERWLYASVRKRMRKVVDMVMDQGYFWQMLVRVGGRRRRRERRRRYFKFSLRYSLQLECKFLNSLSCEPHSGSDSIEMREEIIVFLITDIVNKVILLFTYIFYIIVYIILMINY